MTYGISTQEPPVFTFRVRPKAGAYLPRNCAEVWRDIVIAGGQTMEQLAEYILEAFDFDNDHLSSFFMSGKRNDHSTEIMVVSGDEQGPVDSIFAPFGPRTNWPTGPRPYARDILMRDIPLTGKGGKKEFLYYFDFGDSWQFGVQLLGKSDSIDLHAIYPRIVASIGAAPEQYPDPEAFWGGGDDEDEEDDVEDDSFDAALLPFPSIPKKR